MYTKEFNPIADKKLQLILVKIYFQIIIYSNKGNNSFKTLVIQIKYNLLI